MINVINFSGGRTSAYMAKRLIDEGLSDYVVFFQNTGKEMPATLDFVNRCDREFGLGVVWLEYRLGNTFEVVTYETASRDGRPFSEIIQQNKNWIPSSMARYCTGGMKVEVARKYIKSLGHEEYSTYLGIRYDEPRRVAKIKASKRPRYEDIYMPLYDWRVTKKDVLSWWSGQSFDLQVKEPYGNCDCCFLKGKGLLARIARENPPLMDWWIEQEKTSGRTFKNGISYEQIKNIAQSQPTLFDGDPSFECFCNID